MRAIVMPAVLAGGSMAGWLALALVLAGCGSSQIERHGRVVVSSHDTLEDVVAPAVERWADAQADEAEAILARVEAGELERDEATQRVEALGAAIRRARSAYALLAEAHSAYATAVVDVERDAAPMQHAMHQAGRVVRVWRELSELTGGAVPPPPDVLVSLTGGE